jgi:hypothetical protein
MDAESGSSQRERCSLDANSLVRVRIQILAPGNRPVQISENLGRLQARHISEVETTAAATSIPSTSGVDELYVLNLPFG